MTGRIISCQADNVTALISSPGRSIDGSEAIVKGTDDDSSNVKIQHRARKEGDEYFCPWNRNGRHDIAASPELQRESDWNLIGSTISEIQSDGGSPRRCHHTVSALSEKLS